MPALTNATKAGIIALVNATLGLLLAFGVPLTEVQTGAVLVFVNAALGLFVGVTFKDSPKRVPDGTGLVKIEDGKVV